MKQHTFVAYAVLMLLGLAPSLVAVPIGGGNEGLQYLEGVYRFDRWRAGVYANVMDREVEVDDSSMSGILTTERALTYVGYEILPWASGYLAAGMSKAKIDPEDYDGGNFEYGGGLQFNLLDHDLMGPTLTEDRLRVNAGAQLTKAQGEIYGEDVEWLDFFSSLTVGLVNDLTGDKFFVPDSISLYAGPAYSDLFGDVEATTEFGLVAGLEIFWTEGVTFDLGYQYFEEDGFYAGVNFNF